MAAVLTAERLLSARNYLFRSGRPLEQQLFRHHFEQGDSAAVLAELATCQMPDGGFRGMGEGNPDVSSPAGTACAFQILEELSVPTEHPMVRTGIGYLLSSYEAHYDAWSPNAHDAQYLAERLPQQWGNPGAEIVAHLWRYSRWAPEAFLKHVTRVALARLDELPLPVPGFSDLCYLRLAQSIPDPSVRTEIHRKIAAGVRQNLELDHAKWHTGYFIKPYWYAMKPDCPLHDVLEDEINAGLDFDLATQELDGSAHLTFNVAGDELMKWKSIWTLEMLKVLRSYGRIAPPAP